MNTLPMFNPNALADVEAEDALIGLVLAYASALPNSVAHCTADDFIWEPRGRIFEAAQLIRAEGMTVTPLTIKARLSGETVAEIERKAGGHTALAYLETVANLAPLGQGASDVAKVVSDLAQRRRIDAELEAARERLAARERPIMDCIAGVIEATGVAAMRAQARNYLPPDEAVDAVMLRAQDALNGKPTPAIRSGLVRLDEITGGFYAGDLVIVAGRPGMGKSVLLTNVCRAAAEAGAPVLLFSLEMLRDQIIQRLITDCDYDSSGPDDPLAYSRFRSGKFTTAQFDRAVLAGERVKRLGIEVIDTPGLSIAAISALAERFAAKHGGLGVIVIDYLQICAPSDRYKGAKYSEVTEISNGAKALAKRIGWPVVIGCQLNRGVEGRDVKRPRLADLRDSGAIEQDADVVLGLFREAYYVDEKRPVFGPADASWPSWNAEHDAVRNDLDVIVLKNRNGPKGLARCHIEVAAGAIRNRREDQPQHPSGRIAS